MCCKLADHRRVVLEYYEMAFCLRDPERAATLYLHEEYVHHGQGSGSSRQDFILYFLKFFRMNPKFKAEILLSVSEGDMVVLRVATKDSEQSRQKMIAEFYHLESGKIKEHWHVIEN